MPDEIDKHRANRNQAAEQDSAEADEFNEVIERGHRSIPLNIFDDLKRMTYCAERQQGGAQQQITGGERDEDDAHRHKFIPYAAELL